MSNYKDIAFDTDTVVYGSIISSYISSPEYETDTGKPVYTITVKVEDGLGQAFGLLCQQGLGMACINNEELCAEYIKATRFTFTTVIKPGVSGVDEETNEFNYGDLVKLSVRFEAGEGKDQGDGAYFYPQLILRFADKGEPQDFGPTVEPISEEILSLYDF